MEFCRRLSVMPAERATRRVYRLPTEAEWEYACRAGTTTRWYSGDDEVGLQECAWFNKNSGGMTHPVGGKRPNAWGLYDMSGNVNQCCADWYSKDYYAQPPPNDPTGPTTGTHRVLRGGSWPYNSSFCRSAFRNIAGPASRYNDIGFRVVAEVAPKEQEQPTTPTATRTAGDSNAPPPAIAPFDATKATQHQKQWAEHLGVQVEETNSIGMPLILIPPGEFDMGSMDEEIAAEIERAKDAKWYCDRVAAEGPRHRVKITKPFYMAMYQVTQGEYKKVMGVNPSAFTTKQMEASGFTPPLNQRGRDDDARKVAGKDTSRHPVETVNCDDCMEFCRKLSAMPAERAARRVYRLPTEAEGEYACRAGTTTRWYCGDDETRLPEYAWFSKNAGGMTHPVGQKKANAWGLYDMHGNVWQWCADEFSLDYYKQSPPSDPTGPPAGSKRVVRGGYWASNAYPCRSACRAEDVPAPRSHAPGFRVVAGP